MKKYSKEHQWVLIENNQVFLGITDYAAKQLKDIVFVEVPEKGEQFNVDDQIATVESVKTSAEVYTPITGKVLEINQEVIDNPEILNAEPEGKGWLVVLTLENPDELQGLMDKDEYLKYIE